MVIKLITEAGYYNGVFKPAGQTYDDGTVGTNDAPADLAAPGTIEAENIDAGVADTMFFDNSGLTGQLLAQEKTLGDQSSEGSSSVSPLPSAQLEESLDAKPIVTDPPAPIPVLDAIQGEQKV